MMLQGSAEQLRHVQFLSKNDVMHRISRSAKQPVLPGSSQAIGITSTAEIK
jgi:hypothetical protein